MRYFILCCLALGLSAVVSAQQTISGVVFDQTTQEPLIGASVYVPTTFTGTATDVSGKFNLQIPSGIDSFSISYTGYTTRRVAVQSTFLSISMTLAPQLGEAVIITANRDAQVRSEIPMSITKIDASLINDTKPALLPELLNKVPGVVMLNLNNEQHGMSIRQPMGYNAYFLYLEDGIPLRPMGVFNHNALIEMNQMSVSSIEVVKGPVSSLYGPEAVGGGINFITLRPSALFTSKLGVQFDQWGYKRIQYSAGAMLTKRFGFALGGYYTQQQPGWMTYSDYNKNAINARLDYEISKKTHATLAVAYNNYYSETPGSVDSIAFFNRDYVSAAQFTYRKVVALRTRLSIEHKWNNQHSTTLHLVYRDNTIAQNPSYSIRWRPNQTTATGEINDNSFTSRAVVAQHVAHLTKFKTKLVGGVSLDYSPVTYNSYQIDLQAKLRPGGQSVEEYTIVQERPDKMIADYESNLWNTGTFLQADIKPIDKLTFTVGGRYDNMTFTYYNYLDSSSGRQTYQQFTPKLGATYKLNTSSGVFINFGKGFSPPALTSIFRKKPNTDPAEFYYNLKPATFTNYEIGYWSSWFKSKIQVDASFYYMIGKNELLSIRQPDNSTDFQSAGKTTHYGIEYGFTFKPNKEWNVRLSAANAIHRFDNFVLSTNPNDAVQDVNGKLMPAAPTFIANAEVMYKPKYLKGFRIGVEWQRMSAWYENQTNTVKYEAKSLFGLSGISVLNFRTGYEWKAFEVYCTVLNITNELYASMSTRGNAPTAKATYTPAPPRTVMLGFQWNFTSKKK